MTDFLHRHMPLLFFFCYVSTTAIIDTCANSTAKHISDTEISFRKMSAVSSLKFKQVLVKGNPQTGSRGMDEGSNKILNDSTSVLLLNISSSVNVIQTHR